MARHPFATFKRQDVVLVQQRAVALQHHCRLANETMHPRFAFLYRGGLVLLTVNSGYE